MATQAQTHPDVAKKNSMSHMVKDVEKDTKPVQAFFNKFNNDWVMNFSGMLAYNLLLSIFPIAIATLSIIGLILGSSVRASLLNSINNAHVLPPNVSPNIVENILTQLNKQSGILGIIAIVSAIFFGSRLFIVIEGCFDIIYHVRPRTVIPQNVMALLMLLVFVLLIPIMVVASSLPTLAAATVLQNTFLGQNPVVSALAGIIGGLVASFILFEAIYVVVPNQHITIRHSWLGAVIAAIALEIYLLLFPLYLKYFLNGYVGQVGFAIALLVFFYYFAVILLVGAEVNAFFSEHVRPLPNDMATFVSTMGGKLNEDRPDVEAAHVDPEPTNKADERHIARTRGQEIQTQQNNMQKQQQIAAQGLAKASSKSSKKKGQKAASKGSSMLPTVVAVTLGSLFAALLEFLRLRRKVG